MTPRLLALLPAVLFSATLGAQVPAAATVPPLAPLVARPGSDLAHVVERFSDDLTTLSRRYDADDSPAQRTRMRAFYTDWRTRLREVDFDKLKQEGRADYVLLDNYLIHAIALLDRDNRFRVETTPLLPFADRLLALQDARRNLETINQAALARTLAEVARSVDSLRALFEPGPRANPTVAVATNGGGGAGPSATPQSASPNGARPDSARAAAPKVSRTVANRAAEHIDELRRGMTAWYRYYDGYDPLFSWWTRDPYRKLDTALVRYARTLRERVVGMPPASAQQQNTGPIIGDPIGADGLKEDLRFEMIPYTPEELIAIAEREYAFSLSEIKKASREMGFGDNWKAAMEKVKNTYVEPGKQPDLIRDMARQAEEFFDKGGWVTIPPLAKEDWRMEMMSPERQRVAPFFLGGDQILVSYPTADMTDEEKLMSMRGNNPHFSHATVFHELNPGHHLQGFMLQRYNSHRSLFRTPFWNEGQSLYWEMFLWDTGKFHVSPEDRIGALFWRMHRSARIIFSLNFHLGKMTPEQAVQFLVDTVNFERANADGEVRRSFGGQYSPLYQAAYMLGGLQLRALHAELVDSKKMTDREFHDAVLMGGAMPITMIRARLENLSLTRDGVGPWRFADKLPAPVPFSK
ncbi:MAG TPA: DUF885 family protein [Gemmatimonadaceae bacterium]|nr:DUF885 family protein [Gemmatimonadaceae bacterium]